MYVDPTTGAHSGQAELPCDEETIRLQCRAYQFAQLSSISSKPAWRTNAEVYWVAELGARCRLCAGRWLMKGVGPSVQEAIADLIASVTAHMITCADQDDERGAGR